MNYLLSSHQTQWFCCLLNVCLSDMLCNNDRTFLIQFFRWSLVVYFDQLSSAVCTRKLVKRLFSAVFNLFLLFEQFSVNFLLKSRKNVSKHLKKTCFKLIFKAGWHANAGWLPEGVTWICLLLVDFLLIVCISLHLKELPFYVVCEVFHTV